MSGTVWEYNPTTGTYGYNNQTIGKSAFEGAGVNTRMGWEDAGSGLSGIGSKDYNLGNGFGLLGDTKAGKNGAMSTTMGYGGLALGAFDAWNSWNQGNKMYDLQSEAFDFSKDKFWNNMAMQRDAYNRDINRKNFMNSKVQQADLNPNMTHEEKRTMNAEGLDTYMNDGNAIRDLNGNESNVINIPGQYTPGQQSAFNQEVRDNDMVQSAAFPNNNDRLNNDMTQTMLRNPGDALAKSNARTIARTAGMNPGYAAAPADTPKDVARPRTMNQSAKSYQDPKTKVVNKQRR